MKTKLLFLVSCLLVLLAASVVILPFVAAQEHIAAVDAIKSVGQKATVCGTVASVTYASRVTGQPTFLNLDEPYPNQAFTVVIWRTDRRYFHSTPEAAFRGKRICVTGFIKSFMGKPEIIVSLPSQITFAGELERGK